MTLLHVLVDIFSEMVFRGEKWLWLIVLEICINNARTHVLNKIHGKTFVTWNRLHVFVRIVTIFCLSANIGVCSLLFKSINMLVLFTFYHTSFF